MKIDTVRFGAVEIEPSDLLHFPTGLLGLEDCHQWVLLADVENDALGWLKNSSRPEIAFAVVCPRRFVPDYQVRIPRTELATLELAEVHNAQVLAIVGKNATRNHVEPEGPARHQPGTSFGTSGNHQR